MGLFQKSTCGNSMFDGTGCKNCAKCIEAMKANFEHYRQQLVAMRQRTHDIQRAESTRYGKLEKSIYGYMAELSVGTGYVKRGQDWFWDEEKFAKRGLNLSHNDAEQYGLLLGRVERAERALAAMDKDGDLRAVVQQAGTDRVRARGALRMLKNQLWEITRCREDSARNRGKRDKMRRVLVKLGKIIDTGGADAMQRCRQIIKSVTSAIDENW